MSDVNTKGRKRDDSTSPPKPAAALATPTTPS